MKSQKLLESFTAYCKANPELRFWQALRNWCGWNFIMAYTDDDSPREDTYYWTTRDGSKELKNENGS